MYSHGDLVLHSIRTISLQNTLLPFRNLWFPLFSSLLAPCGFFDYFLLLESTWGARTLLQFTGAVCMQCEFLQSSLGSLTISKKWRSKKQLFVEWETKSLPSLPFSGSICDDRRHSMIASCAVSWSIDLYLLTFLELSRKLHPGFDTRTIVEGVYSGRSRWYDDVVSVWCRHMMVLA